MAKNIVELNVGGVDYTTRPHGTCSTAASTAAKVVTCTDFNLCVGATVIVEFTNANTAANPTLNVNSTGAKPIYFRNAAISGTNNWGDSDTVEFYYNGTQWELIGGTTPYNHPTYYWADQVVSGTSSNTATPLMSSVTASSNIRVGSTSKTSGGCNLVYDSTNQSLKFVF